MKKHHQKVLVSGLLASLLVWQVPAMALEMLSDDEMSSVSGKDGLAVDLSATSMAITEASFSADSGATAGGGVAENIVLSPVAPASTVDANWTLDVGSGVPGAAIAYELAVGPGRLGGAGTDGFLARLNGDASRYFGEWSAVTSMGFGIKGQPLWGTGLDAEGYLSMTDGTLFYRQFPGHAVLTMDNFNFLWSGAGNIDAETDGIRIASPTSTFRIDFDIGYKNHVDQDMTNITANDRPMLRFGWGGTLVDSIVYLRGGGLWDTSADAATDVAFNTAGTSLLNKPAGMTQGFNFGMRWNYQPGQDFIFTLGVPDGDREYLEFADWLELEQATGPVPDRYGFDFPMITFDSLDSANSGNDAGSLCWGDTMTGAACSTSGELLNIVGGTIEGYSGAVNRTGGSMAVQTIRNGNLLAWSNSVRVLRDPDADGVGTLEGDYDWGLIYTLANINSNIYVYPGGNESDPAGGSRNYGLMADILFMTQTPDVPWSPDNVTNSQRWSHGTHFMIADTDPAVQQGIGLLGSDFLLAADDVRVWIRDTENGETYPNNWDGGIDLFSPRTRAQITGLFGGVRIPNGHDLVRGAMLDFNYEGVWTMRLSPPPSNILPGKTAESNGFLAYSAGVRLRCSDPSRFGCSDNVYSDAGGSNTASGQGSYIAVEEPGRPGVDLRMADMSGDVAWTEGIIQLRSGTDTDADTAPGTTGKTGSRPDLSISGNMRFGASAADHLESSILGTSMGSGGDPGRTFTSNVQFSGQDVISWAVPAGTLYYDITLMPQQ